MTATQLRTLIWTWFVAIASIPAALAMSAFSIVFVAVALRVAGASELTVNTVGTVWWIVFAVVIWVFLLKAFLPPRPRWTNHKRRWRA